MKKICGVKFSKSKKMSKVVLYMCNNVSEGSKGSYLLPSNLLHSGITFSLIPTNFSTAVMIFHFPCANHMDVKFFGMSSYRLESSSIIKCGTWRLFYIYSTSSYLLQLLRYLYFSPKKPSKVSYIWMHHIYINDFSIFHFDCQIIF